MAESNCRHSYGTLRLHGSHALYLNANQLCPFCVDVAEQKGCTNNDSVLDPIAKDMLHFRD